MYLSMEGRTTMALSAQPPTIAHEAQGRLSILYNTWYGEKEREEQAMSQHGESPEQDPVFTNPEAYGIENLESPGEPNRTTQPPSEPVVGTGHDARLAHQQAHDAEGDRLVDPDNAKMEREEGRAAVEAGLDDAEAR